MRSLSVDHLTNQHANRPMKIMIVPKAILVATSGDIFGSKMLMQSKADGGNLKKLEKRSEETWWVTAEIM